MSDENRETIWQEYKRRARPVIIDLLMWITIVGAMAIIFGLLKLFESIGYDHDKIETLENIHYICSASIIILGGFDMFMKMLAFVGGGK